MIIDFWHTKCQKCPAALEKLNKLALAYPDLLFVACALSLGENNIELVAEMIDEWDNLTHVFVSECVKEQLKTWFQFSAVPFALVVDQV